MIRLAIVGTGGMAAGHAQNFQAMRGVKVTACCDVDKKIAQAFAAKHEIPAVYTNVDELLSREELDAVDIVASDPAHAPLSIAAAKKGLHVLCEKPLTTNSADARRMVRAVEKAGVANMVNFSYRRSSALQKAREMVLAGELGELRHVEACYRQSWLMSKVWGDWRKKRAFQWRLSKKYGDGALGDIGCHIMDFTSFVAGDISKVYCELKTFDKGVRGKTYKGYRLDANDSAVINATFANGAIGTIQMSRWMTGHRNTVALRVFGTKGALRINLDESWEKLNFCMGKDIDPGNWRTRSCGKGIDIYPRFIKAIRSGTAGTPSFAEGARIVKYTEKCLESARQKKPLRV